MQIDRLSLLEGRNVCSHAGHRIQRLEISPSETSWSERQLNINFDHSSRVYHKALTHPP